MRRVSRTGRRVVPKKRVTEAGAKAVTSGKAVGAEQSRKACLLSLESITFEKK